MVMRKSLFRAFIVILALFTQASIAMAQCAMCRGSVESQVSAGETTMAANLNLGILYLFFAPYVLLGTLAFFWYRSSKRNGKKIVSRSHLAG